MTAEEPRPLHVRARGEPSPLYEPENPAANDGLGNPIDITVEGEYAFGPLRAEGFGDFFPDDPAAAVDLSDRLVANLYVWAKSIDTTLNLHLRDREEGKYDGEWERLFHEGAELARRVAHELGPDRAVTYKGLANGGLAAITSIPWRGDRQL
ncbi:hypothetical protein [Streptomyces sp. NPDC093261]|uniref:hypothetical protein n=1 Tax=Streptomyces sp. NPDC093261 TaxID=3366037 RepID=UPI0037F2BCDE